MEPRSGEFPPQRADPDRAQQADPEQLLASGRRVLREEAEAIVRVADGLDAAFVTAVRWCYACTGRVLVSGLGKSGIIARKIAATLTSTGTPALFVHPVEALHGDLGIAGPQDILLAISRGGRNSETLVLQDSLRTLGLRTIALTTDATSDLARRADLLLLTPMEREACPLDLTPTTSTTAALALGDALALTLLELRDFRREDFAVFHPSGTLGRTLRATVEELMHRGDELPRVEVGTSLRDAMVELAAKRLGCVVVCGADGRLAGFLSDGDLKRAFLIDASALEHPVDDFMTRTPRSVEPGCLARTALQLMEGNAGGPITQLVVAAAGVPVGVVHIHDILKMGLRSG